jgi:hydrogenase maturation protease
VLILGCGNPDRSDDCAGVLVARRLREMGIDAQEFTGDPLALIEAWNGTREVILIDTVVSGATAGTIAVWDAGKTPLPPEQFCCSTHAFGIAEAVEIARALGRLPPRLLIYGIEGIRFDLGGSPSTEVAAAVERLAQEIGGVAQDAASGTDLSTRPCCRRGEIGGNTAPVQNV